MDDTRRAPENSIAPCDSTPRLEGITDSEEFNESEEAMCRQLAESLACFRDRLVETPAELQERLFELESQGGQAVKATREVLDRARYQ